VGAVADSQILGAICDVVLLVIKAEKSTKRLSLQAKASLNNVGANLLGIVVNDVPRRSGRYGYYSGYKYRGYYGYYRGYYGRREAREKHKSESAAVTTSKKHDSEEVKEKLTV
jgi:Mrp family chromosome partitioning ATPase